MCAAKKLELMPTLDLMNSQLETTQAYLVGSTFTLADLTFLPYFALFEPAGLSDPLAVKLLEQRNKACLLVCIYHNLKSAFLRYFQFSTYLSP